MLLLLCLLLTALTATVSAAATNTNGGSLDYAFKGQEGTFNLSFYYICETGHRTPDGFFTYNLDSVQAKKADGTLVSMAEWRPGDTISANITISGIYCDLGKQNNYACGEIIDRTITKTVEFTGADVANFCHRTLNSTDALAATIEHIRGDNTSDKLECKFYCHLYPFYKLEKHNAGDPTCEEDGYDTEWYRCPLCNKTFSDDKGTTGITVKAKLGHNFNENGDCKRCDRKAEAKLSNSGTYYATAAEAIDAAAGTGEAVIIVSYAADKTDPIILNKIVDLTVNNGVTVPEIRLDTLSGTNTGASMNINNYGTVNLFSSVTAAQQSYPRIFIYNHSGIGKITVSNAQDI